MEDRLDALRKIPILASLQDNVLAGLARGVPERYFQAGEFIFQDGDPGDWMYVIQDGRIEIVKPVDGRDVLLAELGAGEFFGEMALLEESPRMASARAVTDVTLIEFSKEDLLRVVSGQPQLIYEAARVLSSRLRETDLARIAELQRQKRELEEAKRRLERMTEATLIMLSHALDLRDESTEGHSQRVTAYSLLIAQEMGVDAALLESLRLGALLHDIGKIGVSDRILRKQAGLTAEEWEEMRNHPLWGKQIIENVEFLKQASEIVYSHHERMDGQGYPRGLRGDEIPLGARIFAVADAFDALTMDRPYQPAITPEAARDEIVKSAGIHFDPNAVAAFLRAFPKLMHARIT